MVVDGRSHPRHGYPVLLAWGLSGFHTTLFVAVALALLHAAGSLGSALAQLDTLTGIILFLGLWGSGFWSTRFGARGLTHAILDRPFAAGALLRRGLLAGGINGALFLMWLVVVLSIRFGSPARPDEVATTALFGILGGAGPAFIVGALLGFVFAAVDTLLLEVARVLLPAVRPALPERDANAK